MTQQNPSPPRTFGHYSLLEELGRGGQGTVWLAEDQKLKRKVALKLLRTATGTIDDHQLERFQREAEAASKLDHPNICALFDAGDVDGVPYIAFRHIEGETLAARIAAAQENARNSATDKESIQTTVALFEKLARALHRAHEQGLVHRDVKPGNIMLTKDGEPVVLDFGLARDELADDHTLTHSGDLLGTPAYMSPEQLTAQRIPLDRRTDVYSLGATLYECLTLQRPFSALTRADLYQKILTSDPSSASSINRQIPRDLQIVVETAMEKDRNRRYQTALDLAEDLRRFAEFEPIRARPVGPVLRARRWAQRHPVAAVTGLGLFLALAIAVGFFVQRSNELRSSQARALAHAAGEVMEHSPNLALHLALEGVAIDQTPRTLSAVHNALARHHERARIEVDDTYITRLDIAPRRQLIAVGTDSGRVSLFGYDGERVGPDADFGARICDVRFDSTQERVLVLAQGGIAAALDLQGRAIGSRLEIEPWVDATWAPNGSWLAATTTTGPCLLFDRDGQPIPTPTDARLMNSGIYSGAEFAPDSSAVVLSRIGSGGYLLRRDAPPILLEHDAVVMAADICAATGAIATADAHGRTALWSPDGDLLTRFKSHERRVRSIAFSADGSQVLTTSNDMTARLWTTNGTPLAFVARHSGNVSGGAFAGQGTILTWSEDATATLWRSDGTRLVQLKGHRSGITTGLVDARAGLFVSASGRKPVARIWELGGGSGALILGHSERVEKVRFLGTGNPPSVVTVSRDGGVHVSDGQQLEKLIENGPQLACVAVHENRIVAGTREGALLGWNNGAGSPMSWQSPEQSYLWNLDFSPDGESIVVPYYNRGVYLLDARSGEEKAPVHSGGVGYRTAAFSHGGDRIAIGRWNGRMQLVALGGAVLDELNTGNAAVRSIAWSHDDRWLAVGPDDATAKLFDLRDDRELDLAGHRSTITAVDFFPDGKHVLTASKDGTARVWDLEGNEVLVLHEVQGQIRDADVSRDGRWIATASSQGYVRLWHADSEELLAAARRRVLQPDPDELLQFDPLLRR